MYCTRCTSAVFIATGSFPSGVSAPPRSQRNSVSRSCQCRASVEPRQSSSHPQPRLGRWCRQRRSDRFPLQWRFGGASVLPSTSRTMAREFTRCGSALFTPVVGPLFSHPLWVHSFHTRCGSALFCSYTLWCSSKLLGAFCCSPLSVAPCTTFSSVRRALHDVLMAFHELLRGELFAHTRSFTCCVWLPGLTNTTLFPPPCLAFTWLSCSRPLAEGVLPWPLESSRLLSRDRHSCSFRSRRCVGLVRQWALLDSDMLVLIDRSAYLVEPCACACRTKRSSRSAHSKLREPHRGSLSSRFAVLAHVRLWLRGILSAPGWSARVCLISTMFMTLHPWPQLAVHPQHDCWSPNASPASSSPALSFLWSVASMCSAAVCSQEKVTSTSTRARSTTAVVTNSSRVRLRALSTLSVSHLTNHAPT